MKITEIKKKQYSKNVFLVYVDNSFWAQFMDETIVKFNLKSGKDISKELMHQIEDDGKLPLALNTALNLLDKFAKTEKNLIEYLTQKGFDSETIAKVIEKLKQNHFVDDKKFAERYVLTHKQKGKKALSFELKMKGIDEKIINEVLLENLSESQEDIILNLAQKFLKNKNKSDQKTKEKLFRHLASKGFEFDEINKIISIVMKRNDF